jgi:predicted membrane GTPase involved in stress response
MILKRICHTYEVDHGKSILTDSLLGRAGMLSENSAGQKCSLDAVDPLRKAPG